MFLLDTRHLKSSFPVQVARAVADSKLAFWSSLGVCACFLLTLKSSSVGFRKHIAFALYMIAGIILPHARRQVLCFAGPKLRPLRGWAAALSIGGVWDVIALHGPLGRGACFVSARAAPLEIKFRSSSGACSCEVLSLLFGAD